MFGIVLNANIPNVLKCKMLVNRHSITEMLTVQTKETTNLYIYYVHKYRKLLTVVANELVFVSKSLQSSYAPELQFMFKYKMGYNV